jgi:hypothetical protein
MPISMSWGAIREMNSDLGREAADERPLGRSQELSKARAPVQGSEVWPQRSSPKPGAKSSPRRSNGVAISDVKKHFAAYVMTMSWMQLLL